MDWDDVRYFLSVARKGSLRAAAEHLRVNHATVLRRIGQLETELGVRLFEKLPSGYRLTTAGEEILELAEDMEASVNRIKARTYGRDQAVHGPLRVTMPSILASHLLMPDLVAFRKLHPEVELEILSVDVPVNLANREADVAIRNVYDRSALPSSLHGRKGPEITWCIYVAKTLLADWRAGKVERVAWIIKDRYGHPDWSRTCEIPQTDIPFKTTDAAAQITAAQLGVGITLLPCFVGDSEPLLARAPGAQLKKKGTLWLLTHGETRKTRRIRVFTDYIARKLAHHAPRLAGVLE